MWCTEGIWLFETEFGEHVLHIDESEKEWYTRRHGKGRLHDVGEVPEFVGNFHGVADGRVEGGGVSVIAGQKNLDKLL